MDKNTDISLMYLPLDIIKLIALNLSPKDLLSLCTTSKILNRELLSNNYFWKVKYINDFGNHENHYIDDWKHGYINRFNGDIYIMGDYALGEITHIPNLKAIAISSGNHQTLIIDLHCNVWSLRKNITQSSCYDFYTTMYMPRVKAKSVSSGNYLTSIINLDNDVIILKHNLDGNLCYRNINDNNYRYILPNIKGKLISTGDYHTVIVDLDDNVITADLNSTGPFKSENDMIITRLMVGSNPLKAKTISAGSYHTVIVDLDNKVWVFGKNDVGQLGIGDDIYRRLPTPLILLGRHFEAKDASAGGNHTILIDLNDNVWSFGHNNLGQLGNKNIAYLTKIPVQIPNTKAKMISAGKNHSIIVDIDDNVLAFGDNLYGQLGYVSNFFQIVPIKIPNVKIRLLSAGGFQTTFVGKKW